MILKSGDLVDVIAPGYFCSETDIQKGVVFLESLGLRARVPRDICGKDFLHSNTDLIRQKHLVEALKAKDSQMIWCARGGYGSNRLISAIERLKKPSSQKILWGLSDVTTLHLFVNQKWGWRSVHGPLLDRCGKGVLSKKQVSEIKSVLFEKSFQSTMKIKGLNSAAKRSGSVNGQIVGGNMTVLSGSIGTSISVNTRGRFLFLEDWGERGYRLDRMLIQLRDSGSLRGCRGLLLGHFLGGAEPSTGKDNFKQIFKRWADELDIPIWSGIDAGHGETQRCLPLNSPCQIMTNDRSSTLLLNF